MLPVACKTTFAVTVWPAITVTGILPVRLLLKPDETAADTTASPAGIPPRMYVPCADIAAADENPGSDAPTLPPETLPPVNVETVPEIVPVPVRTKSCTVEVWPAGKFPFAVIFARAAGGLARAKVN